MRYVAAYMLAVLGGKDDPSADDVRAIIESVGVEVDETRLSLLLEKLKGKHIEEVQESGLTRLATITGSIKRPEMKPVMVPVVDDAGKTKEINEQEIDDEDDDDDEMGLMDIFG